jgi:CheY-like chemotaxis protein
MDIHMPVMDGIEASVIIHGLGIGIPIVALTANIMTHDKELYRKHGMNDYLGKPFTSQELWRCLLKHFKPMDWQTGKKIQLPKSDDEPQLSLADKFIESNQNAMSEINEAISAGDIKLAYRIVHNIKSNAGFIGKPDLQKAAQAVEAKLKSGENLVTSSEMETLELELKMALMELTKLSSPPSAIKDN